MAGSSDMWKYLVQRTTSASTVGGNGTEHTYTARLPHRTGAGNFLLLYFQAGENHATRTISDDKAGGSSTWVAGPSGNNGQYLWCYYVANCAAGIRTITIEMTGATTHWQCGVYEFCKIAASSPVEDSQYGTGSGTAIGSSPTGGSTTVTSVSNNDLILQIAIQNTNDQIFLNSFTAQRTFEMLHSDLWSGTASQFSRQDVAGAISPILTISSSVGWLQLLFALKTDDAQGTPMPTDVPRVRGRQFHSHISGGAVTKKIQLPFIGGSLAAISTHAWSTGTANHGVKSITDGGNHNATVGAASSNVTSIAGDRYDASVWYCPCISSEAPVLTITFNNTVQEITCCTYEVCGCDSTYPLGNILTASGVSVVSGNNPPTLTTAGTLTPKTRGTSIVILNQPQDTHTITGSTSPSADFFDGFCSPQYDGGFNPLEEDNGHGFYVQTGGAALTFTLQHSGPDDTVGNYASAIAEFLPHVPTYDRGIARCLPS